MPGLLPDVRTPEQIKARAEILAKLQAQLGLHGAAVGERDLALGLKELRRLAKAHRLRLLAANLVDETGKPAFEPGYVTEVAGVKVGLLGVTEVPQPQAAPITEAGLKVQPPAEAAAREVARLRAQGATVIVALAHVGVTGARDLLTKVPDIDVAVVGHTSNVIQSPTRAGKGFFAEAQRQGKQLGEFRLHVIAGQPGFADGGRRRGLVEQMERQRKDYERFANLAKAETIAGRRDMYLIRLRGLRDGLAESCRLAKEPEPTGGSWLEHKLVAMSRGVPDDPEIAAAIRAYKETAPKAPVVAPAAGKAPPAAATPRPVAPVKAAPQ
ncbi:MAG: hypothetical protein HY906_13135 [Deltaproteobacteria bacterium]|nr:hypothetical protein [Deltaproteobacteria bacterium]